MRLHLLLIILAACFISRAQTTNTYTTQTTWTVPAGVHSISVTAYGGAGGTGGQDCGAGCSNPAAGNAGYVVASFAVTPGDNVGIYPGGQGGNGANNSSGSGGGAGGTATYGGYNGGNGGNAGASGSSGGGGGGGAATVLTINTIIKVVAGGAGGGGGMANLANSGNSGTNTYAANGTLNSGGVGTMPPGDGGGGGGGGGGNYGSTGGSTHAAGGEQAGDGGNLGGNLVSGATTTTTNSSTSWTSGGRVDVTFTSTLPVSWLDFSATRQGGATVLNWSTATELNTRSFLVQRSNDGNSWSLVGTVEAAGNSAVPRRYQFTDQAASNSTAYYRLAQVDLDGQINYSKTVTCLQAASHFQLYPNPVTGGKLTVSLAAASAVVVYNVNGQVMLRKECRPGDNLLDCSNCPPGVYYLKAGNEKMSFIVK